MIGAGRLLRYLTEAPAEQALTATDRRALERLCARLPELIPPMPETPLLTVPARSAPCDGRP